MTTIKREDIQSSEDWSNQLFQSQKERLSKAGVHSFQEWVNAMAKIDEALSKNPKEVLDKLAKIYQVSEDLTEETEKKQSPSEDNKQKAVRILTEFKEAVDEKGEKQHPYFHLVFEEMASLLKNKIASSLEEAYQKAVWLNPDSRNELINFKTESELERKLAESKKAKEASFAPHGKRSGKRDVSDLSTRELLELQFKNLD